MSTKTRNLKDIDGANVPAPTMDTFAATQFENFADDAAFEAVFGSPPPDGSVYWNTTTELLREYNGTTWQYDKTAFTTVTDSTTTGADQAITPTSAGQIIRFTEGSLASINNIVPTLQKVIYLINDQALNGITLKNDAGGTAANRIQTGNGQDFVLKTNQLIGLEYDNTQSRWRVLHKPVTGIESFASDAAFVTAHGPATISDRYWNTTELVVREHNGTSWQNNKVLFSTENNSAATGANADVTPAFDQIIKVSNASLTSIRGIIPAIQKFLILVNGTGATVTIRNEEATATAANRIITGTGVDLSLANSASLLLAYDADSTRWRVVGGSGASSSDPTDINYFTDPGFENTANGATPSQVSLYNDGAAAVPVDGTGGSVTGVTFLASTTTPIRGTTSGEMSKDAANRQGMGASFAFTIANPDKGVTAGVSWEMVTSVNYVSGDLVFYIYDVTNSVLITPRATSLPKLDSYGKFFSDYGLQTGTSYRLILHIATTSALAWTVKFDTMVNSTGRNAVAAQTPSNGWVTNWVPTGSWTTNTTYSGRYIIEEDGSIMRGRVLVSLTGAPTATPLLINLPTNYQMDTDKVLSLTSRSPLGYLSAIDTGTDSYPGSVGYSSATQLSCNIFTAGGTYVDHDPVTQSAPFTFGNTDAVMIDFCIPIVPLSTATIAGPGSITQWASDDGSSDVLGPQGSLVPNVAFSTGSTTRSFSFSIPQDLRQFVRCEINFRGNGWLSASDLWPPLSGNNANANNLYGVSGLWSSATVFQVSFGNRGSSINASNVDNGNSSWATENGLGTRFRVGLSIGGVFIGVNMANSSMMGFVAPRKGQYALTVTGTGWTTVRAVGIYYQDQDGNHRLKFNIVGTVSSSSRTNFTVAITGVVAKNVSNYLQACSGWSNGVAAYVNGCYLSPNTDSITIDHASSTTTAYRLSGDVELESKPSWA